MIELFEQDACTFDRQSSKGNQLKWKNKDIWYKADYLGYEGFAECVVSHLLSFSSLSPDEYVKYEPEQIHYRSAMYQGAKSRDFLSEDWQIITLERLFQSWHGESLTRMIWSITDVRARFRFLCDQVRRVTGLEDFDQYLCKMLTIDAFFLNEDRHMHNVAVLMNGDGSFRLCPLFDHGACLLSDTTGDYPLTMDLFDAVNQVKAKTISTDFEEQLEAAEEICGNTLRFSFSAGDIKTILNNLTGYPEEIRSRVEEILLFQIRKYRYLFTS